MVPGRPKGPKPWFPLPGRPPRFLIVRLSALGDVLHALPVLSGLRARFPKARIDWVVEDRAADLLRHRADVDRVVVYPRRSISGALKGVPNPIRFGIETTRFLKTLRAGEYDVAIDLQGNLKSGVITRLSGSQLRYGFGRGASREANHLFTTRRWSPPPSLRHRVERNLGLVSALLGESLPYVLPGFPVPPEETRSARELVASLGVNGDGYVVLHPGTSGFGSFKRWPPERFGALARRLAESGLDVVVTHSPAEDDLAAQVVDASDRAAKSLRTPSLAVLAEVTRDARAFVGADTGPLHLAGLVGTPLLGLFGPKDPAVYGPYGVRADGSTGVLSTLTRNDVACRPCTLRRCADPLCMRTMAPDDVEEALRAVLSAET